MSELELFRKTFEGDRFAMGAGIVIDSVSEDEVVCSMTVTPEHLNAAGGVQGGAIFTLADLAFAAHSNRALVFGEDIGPTVGQSCNIVFLRMPKGRRLIAKSERLSKGRKMSVFRVRIEDESGVQVAEMTASGYTTPFKAAVAGGI